MGPASLASCWVKKRKKRKKYIYLGHCCPLQEILLLSTYIGSQVTGHIPGGGNQPLLHTQVSIVVLWADISIASKHGRILFCLLNISWDKDCIYLAIKFLKKNFEAMSHNIPSSITIVWEVVWINQQSNTYDQQCI